MPSPPKRPVEPADLLSVLGQDLALPEPTQGPESGLSRKQLARDAKRARELAALSMAPSTKRAYRRHIQSWGEYCRSAHIDPLPVQPKYLAAWIARGEAAGQSYSYLQQKMAAVTKAAATTGQRGLWNDPTLTWLRDALARSIGVAAKRKAKPLTTEEVVTIVSAIGTERRIDLRDRALILLGYQGGFRRSELAALEVGDLLFEAQGIVVTIRRSKSDQRGEGRAIPIHRALKEGDPCPVEAMKAWLQVAGLKGELGGGASLRGVKIFRSLSKGAGRVLGRGLSTQSISAILKKRAGEVGIDPAEISGHSLRAGMVTEAARRGADSLAIRQKTGHRSDAMVEGYIREADQFVLAEKARVL